MVSAWRDQLSEHAAQIKAEHERELQKIASVFRVSTENLRAMTQLWATPVTGHLLSIFRTVFLDGLALGLVATATIALLAICGVLPWSWSPLFLFAVGLAVFIYGRSRRVLEPHAALRRGASKLASLMPARYFVMGHTHRATMERLSDTSTYVNLGNWTDDLLDDGVLQAPCTHLVIRHGIDGAPAAELCRWHDGHAARISGSDAAADSSLTAHDATAARGSIASATAAAPPVVS
jgi:hypothetical protein